jgi:DNA-binding response OmpR family regulator
MVFIELPSSRCVGDAAQRIGSRLNRAEAYPRYNSCCMKVLLVSPDPKVREMMALATRSVQRGMREEPFESLEAGDGVRGISMAWRHQPDVVVVDEIASRAGAFALARDLKGADPPFSGAVFILLDRSQDAWLARWSGADAWFVKPVNPFELADTVAEFAANRKEAV